MKRNEILERLGYEIPFDKRKRVIVCSDLKNEADDQFAVMHHLLSPTEDVCGIVASHFEWFPRLAHAYVNGEEAENRFGDNLPVMLARRGKTMEMSFEEGKKLLSLAQIDDIPLLRGSVPELQDTAHLPESEGADFIIREAMKEDARPLYVFCLGGLTDLAIAYLKEPKIAEQLTAIWIGGAAYPKGGQEFNLCQDILAVNLIFESDIPLLQVPSDVYSTMEVSFAELAERVAPCGPLGKYLFEQLIDTSKTILGIDKTFFPETWILGDNPTVSLLLCRGTSRYEEREAPQVLADGIYSVGKSKNRMIRVYRSVDVRLTLADLFAKLRLCYGMKVNRRKIRN